MARARHILLVDQDPEVRLAVDRQLDQLGWEAIIVNSAQEAIRVIEQGLIVEVLLTEIALPDMDGRDLAWTVCRMRPFLRVAFMASVAPGEPLEPRDAPLLMKPFTTQSLANALSGAVTLRRHTH